MIQGPQLINQALTGVAERLLNPAQSTEPKLISSGAEGGRFARSTEGIARGDKAVAADVVTVFTRTSNREAIAHIETEGLRSELVRAETMLQIVQEAFTAIEILHDGMLEIAVMALDETLTKDQRKELNAAFQVLLQDVKDIIDATVFDGEYLLKGGDGPNGAFVIQLSAGGENGAPLDILIPSASVVEGVDTLQNANLLTAEAVRTAMELSGMASEIFALQGDVIEAHRANLQEIFSEEVDPNRSLTEFVESFDSPKYAAGLSHLVADIVLAGGNVPFEDSADRLRDILARTNFAEPPRARSVQTEPLDGEQPRTEPHSVTGDFVRADNILLRAEGMLQSQIDVLTGMRGIAETASGDLTGQPHYRPLLEEAFQSQKGRIDHAARAIEIQGEKVFMGGDGRDGGYVIPFSASANTGMGPEIEIPSMLFADLLPELADATVSTPDAALAAIDGIDLAIVHLTQRLDTISRQHAGVHRQMTAVMPGNVSPERIAESLHGGDDFQLKAAMAAMGGPPAETVTMDERRDQFRRAILDAELPKIREMDAARRASGLVQQYWDPDAIRDNGLPVRGTIYEAPADQLAGEAGVPPADARGFMAELIRADSMLHVAGLSIAQIDLNLDYLHDLAREASTDTSRYRPVLDEVFQVVKKNIIDPLARTAEAQGEKILSGGDGPDGEFVIRLSEGGTGGEGLEIAIPSMRVMDMSPDLFYADIRTRESALAAVDHIAFASADIAQTRDMIDEQRARIRHLIYVEIAQNA